ncbi:KICSTOR complex protein ITFG2, partial [Python bivittatus]|uniref:KICSTOR complex protein ITFG2 n=1 Tax=Python bivittatus TaxID=176946 RepID=A0A9F2RF98_PYTBI
NPTQSHPSRPPAEPLKLHLSIKALDSLLPAEAPRSRTLKSASPDSPHQPRGLSGGSRLLCFVLRTEALQKKPHLVVVLKVGVLLHFVSVGGSKEHTGLGLFALCTLDGTLKLMEGADKLLWSVQVDHQLFALEKLDVTGNGYEEVIACAWDGQTYIIDHNRTVARFQVDENVSAFCAGFYSCKGDYNSPCLVYVSFNQKIYIYWDIQLERMESTNLLKMLESNSECRDLLLQLGVARDDVSAVKDLIHKTLYFPREAAK